RDHRDLPVTTVDVNGGSKLNLTGPLEGGVQISAGHGDGRFQPMSTARPEWDYWKHKPRWARFQFYSPERPPAWQYRASSGDISASMALPARPFIRASGAYCALRNPPDQQRRDYGQSFPPRFLRLGKSTSS